MVVEIVNGELVVDNIKKECPFGTHKFITTSQGKEVVRPWCGTWCALFQRKTWDLNGQVNKDTAYLNCGCGSSYDLTEVDTENKNIGGS